jgi:hypothetical protein
MMNGWDGSWLATDQIIHVYFADHVVDGLIELHLTAKEKTELMAD